MSTQKKGSHSRKQLGKLLVEAGLISEYQLAVALGQQKQWGGKLGAELIRLGFIEERELAFILQEQLGIKWISLYDRDIPSEVLTLFPVELARKYQVMPVELSGNTVTLATINPNDMETMDAIAFAIGKKIKPVMALGYDIKMAINKHYSHHVPKDEMKVIDTGQAAKSRPGDHAIDADADKSEILEKMKMRSPVAQEVLIRLLIRKGVFSHKEFMDEFKTLY